MYIPPLLEGDQMYVKKYFKNMSSSLSLRYNKVRKGILNKLYGTAVLNIIHFYLNQ